MNWTDFNVNGSNLEESLNYTNNTDAVGEDGPGMYAVYSVVGALGGAFVVLSFIVLVVLREPNYPPPPPVAAASVNSLFDYGADSETYHFEYHENHGIEYPGAGGRHSVGYWLSGEEEEHRDDGHQHADDVVFYVEYLGEDAGESVSLEEEYDDRGDEHHRGNGESLPREAMSGDQRQEDERQHSMFPLHVPSGYEVTRL